MVCADAGLHADQTRRQVGEPYFYLAAGPLLAQYDRATSIQTHVQFVDIEEGLSFPMPSGSELDAYVVYDGFDEIGDKTEKKPPARKTATRQQ